MEEKIKEIRKKLVKSYDELGRSLNIIDIKLKELKKIAKNNDEQNLPT